MADGPSAEHGPRKATHVESVPRRYDRLDLMTVMFSGALDAMIAARATRQNVDIVMKRRQSRG